MFILKLIAYLPLWSLYLIADFLFFVSYYVVGYRKKVVLSNLYNSFPDKSEKEIKKIARGFYRSLADFAMELLKANRMSPQQIKERVVFTNTEILSPFKGKTIMYLASHQFNWEWMSLSAALDFAKNLDFIYQPLTNKSFDRYMIELRSRFGAKPISTQHAAREVIKGSKEGRGFAIVGDQIPQRGLRKYWTTFLNQETSFFMGAESLAKLVKCPVFYFACTKVKRGYYKVEVIPIGVPPYKKEDHSILDNYVDAVEKIIQENPSEWLWSHKRWKYTKKEVENHS
ncbi:MAG: lysophospholipid acyltransferase family protein [Cyclobacteriaceae bacterium]|nr:lysophospholipid acyltransferase family protein [Cyclobacteriaceae bacterium]